MGYKVLNLVTFSTSSLQRVLFNKAFKRKFSCLPDITYGLFIRQLKGHLFREAGTRHSVISDMRRLRKTLTGWKPPQWPTNLLKELAADSLNT